MTHCVTFIEIHNAEERIAWALEHCPTFQAATFTHRTITDVPDVSPHMESVYAFHFGDEKDAMWFKLYWS